MVDLMGPIAVVVVVACKQNKRKSHNPGEALQYFSHRPRRHRLMAYLSSATSASVRWVDEQEIERVHKTDEKYDAIRTRFAHKTRSGRSVAAAAASTAA